MRSTIFGGLLLATAAFACSGDSKASGLVLGLQLDLTVPEDTDHVAVLVTLIHDNQRTTQAPAELTPIFQSDVSFVATLVLESHDHDDRVQIRFVAFDAAGNVRAMREALTKVPQSGTALLRMPLLWINDGRVTDSGSGPLAARGAPSLQLTADGTSGLSPQSLTDDVFARLSATGCSATETLGNDGTCQPIEVQDGALVDLGGSVTVPTETCIDVAACFTGVEVRSYALGPGCDLPVGTTVNTQKPALAFTGPGTGGYPLGDAAGTKVRPIDSALYDYDAAAHVVKLHAPLCDKVQRDRIPIALVSAKCDPKTTDTPVCNAPNQLSSGPRPTNAGVFADPAPDGGPADSGADGEGGTIVVPPVPIERVVQVGSSAVYSFAARGGNQGTLWLLTWPQDAGVLTVGKLAWASATDVPTDVPFDRGYSPGQVIIGAHERAYLLTESTTGEGGGPHMGLGDGVLAPQEITVCNPDMCTTAGTCAVGDPGYPSYFTAADVAGQTVGAQALTVNLSDRERIFVGGLISAEKSAGCFEARQPPASHLFYDLDAGAYGISHLYPGAAFGDSFVASLESEVPSGIAPSLLVDSNAARTVAPVHGSSQFVASFGPGRALRTSPVAGGLTSFQVLNPGSADGAETSGQYLVDREVFGGPSVACMRGYDRSAGRQSPLQLLCVQEDAAGLHVRLPALDSRLFGGSRQPFDPHVYADESYLYVGQTCNDSTLLKVRGVPWALLQTESALMTAFSGICGGDVDAGQPSF